MKVLQLGLISFILYVGIVGYASWNYAGAYLGCTVTLILPGALVALSLGTAFWDRT